MPVVRQRQGGGGAPGERGLTEGRGRDLALIRPALEVAWVVARVGGTSRPPVPAPRPIRPFLRFAKLPPAALDVTRRVLDDDVEFRARVLGAASEAEVGRPSWLFLARPEGWEDELRALEEAATGLEEQAAEEAGERDARRRLKRTEDARDEAMAAAEAARAATARLELELAAERGLRRALEADLAEAREAVRKLTAEAGSSRAAAERAREQRSALESEAARLAAEVARVEAELAQARGELAQARAEVPLEVEVPLEAPPPPAPPTDRFDEVAPAVRTAVAEAAAAAARLGEALAAAAAALGGPDAADAAEAAGAGPPDRTFDEGASPDPRLRPIAGMGDVVVSRARERGRLHRPSRPAADGGRVPSPLPPAVFHDSVAAADHLVRLNGVVVLVDGYNVSKEKWPELAIADQRRRLVDALGGLAARTGADVHTVFDGAEQADAVVSNVPRRAVKVTFSPPDVEADDVLIGLVDTIPVHRPVVVVSSDRRVQDGCGCRGANVISSQQLLAIL